jgi:hypothetical protein
METENLDLLDKNRKPPEPYDFYKDGILLHTVLSWRWIEEGSKESQYLKVGWFGGLKVLNFDHPEMKEEMKNLKRTQQECLDRKNIDWDRMDRTYITI